MTHHYNHSGGDIATGGMAILIKGCIYFTPVNLQSVLHVAAVIICLLTILTLLYITYTANSTSSSC
jgi:hypothetical protein